MTHYAQSSQFDETLEGVLAAVRRHNGFAYDDAKRACKADGSKVAIEAIGRYASHTVRLVIDPRCACFCLSPMYVDNAGLPHISSTTLGPVLCPQEHGGLAQAIVRHNNINRSNDERFRVTPIEHLTYV